MAKFISTRQIAITLCGLLLSGCGARPTATLYRNSPYSADLRVHFATFDVKDSNPNFNISNCQMVARLLNANVTAAVRATGKDRDPRFGFWCEVGAYRAKGPVPSTFPEAFPTDS